MLSVDDVEEGEVDELAKRLAQQIDEVCVGLYVLLCVWCLYVLVLDCVLHMRGGMNSVCVCVRKETHSVSVTPSFLLTRWPE